MVSRSPSSKSDTPVLGHLDAQYLEMLQRGVPTMVASCNAELRPSVSMAAGYVLDISAGEVTVFVSRTCAARLLHDIASRGQIAVMCVEPRSHRAVQFKSSAVRIRPAGAADEAALARHLVAVENELMEVGHTREFSRCVTAKHTSDLVALTFAPEQAFNQAPGPHAGAALPA